MIKLKNTLLLAAISSCFSINSFGSTAHDQTERNYQEGQLRGKIIAPTGSDLSSITIQIIGANQKDPFIYYTVPNPDGDFNFDHLLPAGSVVQLYIWDGNGVLGRTVLNAYVSPMNGKETGIYEVMMHDAQYTENLSSIYNTNHDVTRAGLCASVINLSQSASVESKVFVYDRMAKHLGPLDEQNIDAHQRFCSFNLLSPSGSDMYDFVIVDQNNTSKTFSYYLPSTTFLHDALFDMTSALFRPIQPYYLKEEFFAAPAAKWEKLDSVNFATSDDYAYVSYDQNRLYENLFYFPLSNEMVEISYFLNGETSDHFFTLIPRTKLINEKNIEISKSPNQENVYVDYVHPFPVKFVTENDLLKINSNFYYQTWSERLGSAFVSLDLSQFDILDKSEFNLSLRNISGEEVGVFEELILDQNQNYSGFFLHLLPGRYQLFLTNMNGELLWTYEVRSYPNRMQIVTTEWQQTKKEAAELAQNIAHAHKNKYEEVLFEEFESDLTDTNTEILNLYSEQNLIANNDMYLHGADTLCKKVSPRGFLDSLANLERPL